MYRDNYNDVRWGLSHEAVWHPPTDVYETDDCVVVLVEIAGLSFGDYEVLLDGRTLVISGERRDPAEKLVYQQMEIRHGKFRAQVHLPWALESSGYEASYENGFLKVALPKARARRVPVHVTPSE